ncbi:MAG: hypothetical protein ACKVVP_07850 [Chloroflexota bacterium]
MAPYARLDKTGRRVLCGVTDCGCQLAFVVKPRPQGRSGDPSPMVAFGPGWTLGNDGVWTLSRRALRATRAGRAPTWRRPPIQHHDTAGLAFGIAPYDLPAEARCPACGLRQTLDSDQLNVDRNEHRPRASIQPDGTVATAEHFMSGLPVELQ